MRKLVGTVSGPDLPALASALLELLPFVSGRPDRTHRKLVDVPVTADWKDKLLARDVDDLIAVWGEYMFGRSGDIVLMNFPESLRIDGKAMLDQFKGLLKKYEEKATYEQGFERYKKKCG